MNQKPTQKNRYDRVSALITGRLLTGPKLNTVKTIAQIVGFD